MKKIILILAVACVFVGSIVAFTTPGGKFCRVYDGCTHLLTFRNFVDKNQKYVDIKRLDYDPNNEDIDYTRCPCMFQVWYSVRDYITQFAALLSNEYNIDDVSFESTDGKHYMRFNCVNMAEKLLNDNYMIDIR